MLHVQNKEPLKGLGQNDTVILTSIGNKLHCVLEAMTLDVSIFVILFILTGWSRAVYVYVYLKYL